MDIIRTLLLYLVMLTTGAAAGTGATPVPPGFATPTPTPYVTPTPTLVPTQVPTQVPTATPLPTLYMGDRGENVRVMQLRLKELGYLNDDADGIFGKKTKAAVERFQYYNGLDADGVAGPKTLGRLYNDINVVVAPVDVDVTVRPTNTPRASQPPAVANVTVYYKSSDGRMLYIDVVPCYQGISAIYANDSRVPAGYVLQGSRTQTVTVSANGAASPNVFTFVYAAATAHVTVVYKSQKTGATLYSESIQCQVGQTMILANNSRVPQGYTLAGQSSYAVQVSANGIVTPSTVTFMYAEPANANVTVYYVYGEGTRITTQNISCPAGSTVINADSAALPSGFTLTGPQSRVITVSGGVASPDSVTFYCNVQPTVNQPPAANVLVNVYYRSTANNEVLYTDSVYCAVGVNTIVCVPSHVGAGYTPRQTSPVQVTVSSSGVASPSVVTFTFDPVRVTASVPIEYRAGNKALAYDSVNIDTGSRDIYPNAGKVPAGYALAGTGPVAVTVDSFGNASPAVIVFSLTEASAIASVPIEYRLGGTALAYDSVDIATGTRDVYPDPGKAPAGYMLDNMDPVTVTVNTLGVASPSVIAYALTPSSATVSVPVEYCLGGAALAYDSVTLTTGKRDVYPDAAKAPAGFVLADTAPVSVTVDNLGVSSPAVVTFQLKAVSAPSQRQLTSAGVAVSVDGADTSVALHNDASGAAYIPLRALADALGISYGPPAAGYGLHNASWNGHALSAAWDDDALLSLTVDGSAVDAAQYGVICEGGEAYFTPQFFTLLGYAASGAALVRFVK